MANACVISRDEKKEIQEVYAPNKKPSKLFHDIEEVMNDKEASVRIWARAYTPSFKKDFGDWQNNPDPKKTDNNGEPLYNFVLRQKDKEKSKLKNISERKEDMEVNRVISNSEEEGFYGSRDAINHFEREAAGVEVIEEEDGSSYYVNGKTDSSTGEPKRFQRLTDFVFGQFIPDKEGKNRTKKFDPEEWLNSRVQNIFIKANADFSEKIPYKSSEEPLTFDQIKEVIRKENEKFRILGKIMHKMIEGYLKHGDINYFTEDLNKLYVEGGIREYELAWFDTTRVKSILSSTGINAADFGDTRVEFRDNISSELMMVSNTFNIGTANDGIVEHSDGSVSFIDYKTGGKLLDNENTERLMLFSNGMADPVTNSKLNKAKLEVVMRMILAKMNKPDLAVRDLKIVYITKNDKTQIRNIDVQNFLDYIQNNYILTISNLNKKLKSGKLSSADITSTKELLEQKQKELKAMQDAKVFDFRNYQTESEYVHQDDDLSVISDPKERVEWMKNKVANETRESLIKENEVTPQTIKSVKNALFGVLNSFKPAQVTSVETAGTKDISKLASIGHGLRDQKNAFLQSFSVLYETSVDKAMNKIENLLGEQSEFMKANRAVYKEYYERTGKSKALGAKTFSYSDSNKSVPLSEQGVFDFMYTWKTIGGEDKRIGAVYTEQDVKSGKITQAQWNYYKASKSILKEVYEAVYNKVAYIDEKGNKVTYGKEYERRGIPFPKYTETFLPVIPYQNIEEIAERNILTGNLNPTKLAKEAWDNYREKYDLAIQNEDRKAIGVPLKYISSDFIEDDDHSYNVTKAIDVFARHMINKAELDDVYYVGKNTIAALSDVKDPNYVDSNGKVRLQNTIFTLESFINQHILGRRRMTFGYTSNTKVNKQIDRGMDNIKGFISANAFWFAPITALFNGLYGLVTNVKEGLIGSLSKRLFGDVNAVTSSHMLEAARICGIHQKDNLLGKSSNLRRQFDEDFEGDYYKDKVKFMFKYFRLGNKSYNYTDDSLMLGVHNRLFTQDTAYAFQGLGEDLTNEIYVVATMLARKVEVKSIDADGKEITKYLKKDGTYTTNPNDTNLENMWDVYKYNEQTQSYEYTGPTRFLDKDGNEVKGLTTQEILRTKTYLERMYGAYSPEQRTHLERYALGRAIMQFRKFQIMNIRENFTLNSYMTYMGEYKQLFNPDGTPKLKDGQPLYDWQTEVMKNRFNAFRSLAGYFLFSASRENWENMSPENKKQAVRFATQLVFYGVTILLGMGAMIPPEDKDKLYAKRIYRLSQDLSVVDPMNILQSATTIDSYPTQLYKAASAVGLFVNSVATDDRVQSGKYVGDYKGANTVENFLPIVHSANQAVDLFSGK